ncbi:4-aminobutyrate aminotransferase [Colletotrichum paranaense]|uniref:4-aminobutyrate aminotransferase n=1 Tax=Colletotrichum paranaense TaxID=1914294 RepID=A0ABQ9RYV9_9PEZI|nr:4-aminobutyrate aminotransferase [Colletotrichum paranaense]KAK1519827.1 4-aminobutyrate aminotransferase [Colletotrichum paranaense]
MAFRHPGSLTLAAIFRQWPRVVAGVRTFSATSSNRAAAIFSNGPSRPKIMTSSLPRPKVKGGLAELEEVFDTRSANISVDYKRSTGNYLVDADGNTFLDLEELTNYAYFMHKFAQIASIPLEDDNPELNRASVSPVMVRAIASRPALGRFPSADYADLLKTGTLKAAPQGLNQVFTATTGSDANETAYKAGFHGSLSESLSTTRSKPIHKFDLPAFDWFVVPLPQFQYPLDQFATENAAEEKRCLEETELVLDEANDTVAAVVIEPVQAGGSDNHASPAFFRGLLALNKRKSVLTIADEVQTGVGATGKFWAHEHWNLPSPPDMVTFSKTAQAAGFSSATLVYGLTSRTGSSNTWVGDLVRALLFKAIYGEIEKHGLVEQTARIGSHLYRELEALADKYPQNVLNPRGKDRGTFIAWDSDIFLDVLGRGIQAAIVGPAIARDTSRT